MNKYCLAKVVQWAGPVGVAGRKRLQKVVYLLQKAGFPSDAEFGLHHFGPYSRDVAEACDDLVAANVLQEQMCDNAVGTQYTYTLLPNNGNAALDRTELRLPQLTAQVAPFRRLAEDVLARDLWELELGSTIYFFYERVENWDEAIRRACKFKGVDRSTDSAARPAETLAKSIRSLSESGQSIR